MNKKELRTELTESKKHGIRDAAGHKCEICTDDSFEVHHVIPLNEGGQNIEDNLIALCANCHRKIHLGKIMGSVVVNAVNKRSDTHKYQINMILQNVRPKNVGIVDKKVKVDDAKNSNINIGKKEGSVEDNILEILSSNSNGIKKSELVNEVVEKFGRNRGAVSRVLADESDYVSGGTMIQRGIVVKKGDLLVMSSNKRKVDTVKKGVSSTNKKKSKGFIDKVKNALKEFDDDLS